MWCSAVYTHLKLLDRAVRVARFLTGGVFECEISHRLSVAVMCMLYKIRSNPIHQLNDALPGPYLPLRVTRGALVAQRYTIMHHLAAEPRSIAGLLFPIQCPSRIILLPWVPWCGTGGFQEQGECFLLAQAALSAL